ncbi:MAG: L-glutamate gamma-semialdehyde dehydrogenase [Chloroflexi bacterium]|nr:MAG: L-glutamate gamma-semialdehyde dehydrogenase [Chloroflexota bacterium]TMF00970.1 MAG: L-glutamate gamma-semialdehyde dehydrogenase [Chloroflexota bacterium]
MTADGHFEVPRPTNEPVRQYPPGDPHRKSLKGRLAELTDARTEIPMTIGGEHRAGNGKGDLRAPHRKELSIGRYAVGVVKDFDDAINSALKARRTWAATAYHERAAVMLRAASLLAGPWRDTINAATMLGQSKTVHQAEIDSACESIDFWRFNAYFGDQLLRQQPYNDATAWNRFEYRPLEGFVFAVSPFNFTSIAANLPTAPVLMGNTVVFKPATQTLLVSHFLMELFAEAGLPPGVINMVSGSPSEISERVLRHPELAGIHFTGSTEVFQHMWKTVGENIDKYRTYPRLVGETGGKDFVVAHESADVTALRTALVRGAFEYQGQKCSAASRAYVPQAMWKDMRSDMADLVEAIPQGDVADFRNFMGAVIDGKAYAKHMAAIDYAKKSDAAKVVAGGSGDDSVGWFVRPTVIETSDPDFKLMKEELFGPILTVYPYPDGKFEETLELCDRTSPYGLTGAVFARDRAAIRTASETLINAAGNFYINDKPTGAVVGQQPFGGARASGTNDKAGSFLNLIRWTSPRVIKETYGPPTDHRYPFMDAEPTDRP